MKKIDCLKPDTTSCLDPDLLNKVRISTDFNKEKVYKTQLKDTLIDIQNNIISASIAGNNKLKFDVNISLKKDIEEAFIGLGFTVNYLPYSLAVDHTQTVVTIIIRW